MIDSRLRHCRFVCNLFHTGEICWQNLPYPGFAAHSGFIVSSILIVGLSLTLYVVFKRKDWL